MPFSMVTLPSLGKMKPVRPPLYWASSSGETAVPGLPGESVISSRDN